jgi:hypothetical protein
VSSLHSQIASLLPSAMSSEQQQQQQPPPAAATTPQQQPMGTPTQQNAPTPASVSNSSGDQLVCQWQNCGERLPSAEQLYVSSRRCTSLLLRHVTLHMLGSRRTARRMLHAAHNNTTHQHAATRTNSPPGPRLRAPCRSQEHKQPELDLPVGQLPHHHRQA